MSHSIRGRALLLALIACSSGGGDDRAVKLRRASTIASQIAMAGNPYTGAMGMAYQLQQQANANAAAANDENSNRTKGPQIQMPTIQTVSFNNGEAVSQQVYDPNDVIVGRRAFESGGLGGSGGIGGDGGDIGGLIQQVNDEAAATAAATSDLHTQIANTQILAAQQAAQTEAQLAALRAQAAAARAQNSGPARLTPATKPTPDPIQEAKAQAAQAQAQLVAKVKRDPIAAALELSPSQMIDPTGKLSGGVASKISGANQVPKAPGHGNTLGNGNFSTITPPGGGPGAGTQVITLRPEN